MENWVHYFFRVRQTLRIFIYRLNILDRLNRRSMKKSKHEPTREQEMKSDNDNQ